MIFRSLDIETVPDPTAWSPGPPAYKLTSAGDRLGPAWAEQTDPVPPPQACRVVALSTVDVDFSPGRPVPCELSGFASACRVPRRWTFEKEAEHERDLLLDFSRKMSAAPAGSVCLVTWNGRGFDLPVIVTRCLKLGITCGWYYDNRDVRYRYSAEGHLDLMDHMADYGACRPMKLGDAARLVGLPGKTDMDGSKVSDLVALAEQSDADHDATVAKIARYCLQDTLQTSLLHLRVRYHMGKLSADAYNAALATFEDNELLAEHSGLPLDWQRLRVGG